MTQITLYTKDYCPYCKQAKDLLRRKGVSFTEHDIQFSEDLVKEMVSRSGGRRTVPQIFIGERHIGGASELFELDRQGKLEALLAPFIATAAIL